MAHKKVVIALGGNALEEKGLPPTAESQLLVVRKTAEHLAAINAQGYYLAVVHGNGPQVGRIVLASQAAANVTPAMPFDVCGAMSQGYIGYQIQQALAQSLKKRGNPVPVVTIVTQVIVDPSDPAFTNPTKYIGPFYTEEEAKKHASEKGWTVKEDSGRGWRRVVPSPKPKKIVELPAIHALFDTTVLIACGGGGVPVVEKEDGSLEGIAAVIDKDLASGRLAEDIDADVLLILTEVEKVAINFRKPDQRNLDKLTIAEAEELISQGHFPPGSMGPKMQAAVDFAKSKPGRIAIISSLDKGVDALAGSTGTRIVG